jgi:hypothetical protein
MIRNADKPKIHWTGFLKEVSEDEIQDAANRMKVHFKHAYLFRGSDGLFQLFPKRHIHSMHTLTFVKRY